jgi:hypothetical protein
MVGMVRATVHVDLRVLRPQHRRQFPEHADRAVLAEGGFRAVAVDHDEDSWNRVAADRCDLRPVLASDAVLVVKMASSITSAV